jgi:hypothetical protein
MRAVVVVVSASEVLANSQKKSTTQLLALSVTTDIMKQDQPR